VTTKFSIKMRLFISLHSVKDTENESANFVTLRAKGLVKIQIGSPSEFLLCTSTSKVTKFRQI